MATPGWILRAAGGLPRTYWYLWVGNLVNRSGGFVSILLAFYLVRERGLSASVIGLVIGLIGAGGAVGVVIGGQLADRWGRRNTLLLAQTLQAAALTGLGLARPVWLIVAVATAYGLAQSMTRPAFAAMMVDVVPDADRVRAFSLNYWANNLAFTVAALLAGLLANVDYLLLFVVDAATTLLMAAIVFLRVPESRPDPAAPDAAGGPTPKVNPLRDGHFLVLCAAALLSSLVFLQYQTALPLSMAADGLAPATYGTVIALNAVLIVLAQPFVPRLVEGRDRSRALAVAQLIAGAGFGLTALAGDAWAYAATVLVWTVGEMIQNPAGAGMVAQLSPAAARGRYQGAYSLAIAAASFLAPLLGGLALDTVGEDVLWPGCFAVAAGVAALYLLTGPSRERRIAELTAAPPARS